MRRQRGADVNSRIFVIGFVVFLIGICAIVLYTNLS